MTATELRQYWHAAPFVPFNIILAGAEKLPVPHPDFLSVSPSGRIATVWKKGDDHTSVDVMLITAIETNRNGTKTGRRRR